MKKGLIVLIAIVGIVVVIGMALAALAVNGSRLNTMTRHRKMLRMRFFICFPPP